MHYHHYKHVLCTCIQTRYLYRQYTTTCYKHNITKTDNNNNSSNNNNNNDIYPRFYNGCLTRDFIDSSLYGQNGYFNNTQRIVQINELIHEYINWSDIKSYQEYHDRINKIYSKTGNKEWVTPVDLYQPYYGYTIAQYIIEQYNNTVNKQYNTQQKKFNIIEVGGGNGTLAHNILQYLQKHNIDLYNNLQTYTIVDYSKQLNQQQSQLLIDYINDNKVILQNKSAVDIELQQQQHDKHASITFIVGIELLDNMSHDKIIYINDEYYQCHVYKRDDVDNGGILQQQLQQGRYISGDITNEYAEIYKPVTDEYIKQYLDLMNNYDEKYANKQYNKSNRSNISYINMSRNISSILSSFVNDVNYDIMYVPTTSYRFISQVIKELEYNNNNINTTTHLLLADFNDLPHTIAGYNGPSINIDYDTLISSINHTINDSITYLESIGSCDIIFPTNFNMLGYVIDKLIKQQYSSYYTTHINIYSNKEFISRYAGQHNILIKQLYGLLPSFKPMQDDYINFKYIHAIIENRKTNDY